VGQEALSMGSDDDRIATFFICGVEFGLGSLFSSNKLDVGRSTFQSQTI
jgi:hypothetical protein